MGRALAFADPKIIEMATHDFVAVAADDWYQRRRQDDEGEFFRSVANQGPRKGQGGSSRQGIYCFTADGKLLAYKNAGQDPQVMRDVLRTALRAWDRLPASRREPGAVRVPEPGKPDEKFMRTPPAGGLILKTYTRLLDRNRQGDYVPGSCDIPGADHAARDHVWLNEAETRGLLPDPVKVGTTFPVPEVVTYRLALFHLLDNTRGEPPLWRRGQLRAHNLSLTVEAASATAVKLRLEGAVVLANNADAAKATRGFDARLLGYLSYNPSRKVFEQFDLVAVGDHWGEGEFTHGARPGRTPLGVAFTLSPGTAAADLVPPQGARVPHLYFRNDP